MTSVAKLKRLAEILKSAKKDGLNGELDEYKKLRQFVLGELKAHETEKVNDRDSNSLKKNPRFKHLESKPNLLQNFVAARAKIQELTQAGVLPELKRGATKKSQDLTEDLFTDL